MGDPRKLRNKFERPKKLWDEERIKHDSTLKSEYGLKNASEVWRASGELKKYRREARRLLSLTEEERKDDAVKILKKLARYSILKDGSVLDDVLGLEVRSILERRLQTLVLRRGLARTMSQARQLVTHGFIGVNGRKITRPGYMVTAQEEPAIMYIRAIDISVRPEDEEPAKKEAPAQAKAEQAAEAPKPEAAAPKPEEPKEAAAPAAETAAKAE